MYVRSTETFWDSDAEFPRMRSLYFQPPFAYCIAIKYILPYTEEMGRVKVWTGVRRVMAPGDIKFNVDTYQSHKQRGILFQGVQKLATHTVEQYIIPTTGGRDR